MTVYKYLLSSGAVELPEGAQILHVAGQGDTWCIWALVDPKAKMAKREFEVYGTGHTLAEDPSNKTRLLHIGTFLQGPFVWHVFERISFQSATVRQTEGRVVA